MLRFIPGARNRAEEFLIEADGTGESGSSDVGAEPGVVEDHLLRWIDRGVGVISGNPVHLVDIADALFGAGAAVLARSVGEDDDVPRQSGSPGSSAQRPKALEIIVGVGRFATTDSGIRSLDLAYDFDKRRRACASITSWPPTATSAATSPTRSRGCAPASIGIARRRGDAGGDRSARDSRVRG